MLIYFFQKNIINRHNIDKLTFKDIFVGNCPKFEHTKKKIIGQIEQKKQKKEKKEHKEREKKEVNDTGTDVAKKKGRPTISNEEKQARKQEKENAKMEKQEEREKYKEEMKLKIEKEKIEKKKEREREREIQKEERRLLNLCMREWNKIRDDLDCEDHTDIPQGTIIQCRIPNELFGQFMVTLEFMNAFSDTVELKDVYSQGITFDNLEHALVEKEVAGLFNDLLQLLLGAIFSLQEQEDDEVGDATTADDETDQKDTKDPIKLEMIKSANRASRWAQKYQGAPLQKVPLDALTLTEILRIHLLASGATNVANGLWRHNNRGGFKIWDDPGMQFKLDETQLVENLKTKAVFELSISEKLKILSVLMNQVLTYASVRDIIDDSLEKLKEVKNEYRLQKMSDLKQEREDIAAIKLKQKEDKQRKIDQMLKKIENKTEKTEEETKVEDEEVENTLEQEEKYREKRKQDQLKKEQEQLQQVNIYAYLLTIKKFEI